jgi:hypothetical protein
MGIKKTIKGTTYDIEKSPPTSRKKLKATYKNRTTGRQNTILFGAKGYEHFRDITGILPKSQEHNDAKRRKQYINRHKNNENWNKPSAGLLSRYILW